MERDEMETYQTLEEVNQCPGMSRGDSSSAFNNLFNRCSQSELPGDNSQSQYYISNLSQSGSLANVSNFLPQNNFFNSCASGDTNEANSSNCINMLEQSNCISAAKLIPSNNLNLNKPISSDFVTVPGPSGYANNSGITDYIDQSNTYCKYDPNYVSGTYDSKSTFLFICHQESYNFSENHPQLEDRENENVKKFPESVYKSEDIISDTIESNIPKHYDVSNQSFQAEFLDMKLAELINNKVEHKRKKDVLNLPLHSPKSLEYYVSKDPIMDHVLKLKRYASGTRRLIERRKKALNRVKAGKESLNIMTSFKGIATFPKFPKRIPFCYNLFNVKKHKAKKEMMGPVVKPCNRAILKPVFRIMFHKRRRCRPCKDALMKKKNVGSNVQTIKKDPVYINIGDRRRLLGNCIAAILRYIGFHSVRTDVVSLLTGVLNNFLITFCNQLQKHAQSTKDPMERTLKENGLDGIRGVHRYYEDNVIRRHRTLYMQCFNLALEYREQQKKLRDIFQVCKCKKQNKSGKSKVKGTKIQPACCVTKNQTGKRPESKVTKKRPESKETKNRPEHKVTKNRPESKVTKNRPESKETKNRPESKATKNQPENKVTKNRPEHKVTKNQPESKAAKNQPESKVTKNRPESKVTKNRPESKVTKNRPESKMTKNRPDNEVTEKHPDSKGTKNQPDAKVTENQPEGKVTENQPEFEVTGNQPEFEVTGNQPHCKVTDNQPEDNVIESHPVNKVHENHPVDKVHESHPIDNVIVHQPENKVTEHQPENKVTQYQPEDKVTVHQPEDKVTEHQPEEKVTEHQPEDNVTEYQPEDKVTEHQPEDKVTENQPEDKVAENQPEDKVAENQPEDKVTENQPEDKMTENHPEDKATENHPEGKVSASQSEILNNRQPGIIHEMQSETVTEKWKVVKKQDLVICFTKRKIETKDGAKKKKMKRISAKGRKLK